MSFLRQRRAVLCTLTMSPSPLGSLRIACISQGSDQAATPSSAHVSMPSLTSFDTKSAIMSVALYRESMRESTLQRRLRLKEGDAQAQSSRTPDEAEVTRQGTTEAPSVTASHSSSLMRRLGCHASTTIVGTVDNVHHGKLAGGVEVVQCRVSSHGYRTRQMGSLKLFRNEFLVRLRGEEWVNYTIPNGSRVVVRGNFAMHSTYDMVSKSTYENPVIDVGPGGYIGILDLPSTSSS